MPKACEDFSLADVRFSKGQSEWYCCTISGRPHSSPSCGITRHSLSAQDQNRNAPAVHASVLASHGTGVSISYIRFVKCYITCSSVFPHICVCVYMCVSMSLSLYLSRVKYRIPVLNIEYPHLISFAILKVQAGDLARQRLTY